MACAGKGGEDDGFETGFFSLSQEYSYLMERSLNNIYIRIVLFSLILMPSFRFFDGIPSLRLDDILLIVYPLVLLGKLRTRIPSAPVWRLFFLILIVAILPFSVLNGYINEYEVSFGDFNQVIRIAKYVSIYLMSLLVFHSENEEDSYKIFRFIIVSGVFLFFISLTQYFNIFNINERYVKIIAPTQYETLINNHPHPRPVGMIGNPNELGFMFVVLSLISIFCLVYFKRNWFVICFMIFFFGVVLTLSRGSLLGLMSGLAAFVLVYFFQQGFVRKIKIALVSLIFLIFVLLISIVPEVYDNYTWRFIKVFDIESDSSFSARLDNWSENISIIEDHPILGVGPLSRAYFEYAADNEWLLIWRRYGVFGIIITIMIFVSSIFRRMDVSVRAMYISLICASFVYMIPTAVFHSLSIFPIFLLVMAFVDVKSGVKRIKSTS